MSLVAYKCPISGQVFLVFDGEEPERLPNYRELEQLPPNPSVVHATNTLMSEPQLDSLKTLYELDRLLNIEVEEEKATKAYNEYRRNL